MCAGKLTRIGSFALVSFKLARLPVLVALLGLGEAAAQAPAASRIVPNLESNLERPLRYRPDGPDLVIETGAETFNRSLYGGNTAFRVDGGDRPEFLLYLPGRGGNLRLGVQRAGGARWLHEAARITMRYRPGSLRYEIRDPLLGEGGVVRLTALAYFQTEGLVVEVEAEGLPSGLELVWAYGGVNGQRIYGKFPSLAASNNPDDAGWGQIIPTLSADQYAATIARWYGLSNLDRDSIFPNLQYFTGAIPAIAGPDLGFMDAPPV